MSNRRNILDTPEGAAGEQGYSAWRTSVARPVAGVCSSRVEGRWSVMGSDSNKSCGVDTTRRGVGVVSAAFPAAAEAGVEMLRRGGNAIDAACAAAWALCVCEPAESGLGGQTTMLVRRASGECIVIDGHSCAPAAMSRKIVKRRDQDQGICATTIPSTAITLAAAQRKHGRLSVAEALGPAIRLAREGYRITALQRKLLKWTVPHVAPGSPEAGLFFGPQGKAFKIGEVFRQAALAGTLERLSRAGVEDFYEGEIAREMVRDMEGRGGLVTLEDLRGLALPIERRAMRVEYRGHEVISIPPPGGGVQVLLALRILEGLLRGDENESEWHVRLAQATLCAFRERERWPDHPADMNASLERWLVSRERAERLIADIRAGVAAPVPKDSLGESGNTTHLCAADAEGNVVSLTQSIQSVFGAKVAHPTLGFVYNNYLSACPRHAHPYQLGPRSLPQSNAAPTIVLGGDGRPRLAVGSAGSRRITSSIVQVLSAVLDRGRNLTDAVGMPRAHALLNGKVWAEESIAGEARRMLGERVGAVRVLPDMNYKLGAVQGIAWDERGEMQGAGDPRRDGATRAAE